MTRVYELPTHLGVEDQLIASLTATQLVRVAVGASLGYAAWDQLGWVPDEVRLPFALIVTAIGVAFAVIRPAGRALDQWLLAYVLFLVMPRRLVWRKVAGRPGGPDRDEAGWAELTVLPTWPGDTGVPGDFLTSSANDATTRDSRWTKA